jgi:hypothetical protein
MISDEIADHLRRSIVLKCLEISHSEKIESIKYKYIVLSLHMLGIPSTSAPLLFGKPHSLRYHLREVAQRNE